MNTPYYTLIIPHFNIPQLLRRLLTTVPKRDDLQVIVVDDCSTKNLEELAAVKADYPWVEWYDTGTNGGGGKARNIGLTHAKGTYVLFADADDYFTPGIIEVLNEVRNTDNIDLYIFSAASVNTSTYAPANRALELNKTIELYKKNKVKGELGLRYCFGEPWCKIVKRSLIESNGLKFDELPCHNDTYFSYMIGYYANNLKVLPIVGYTVTYRENSVINTKFQERESIVFNVFKQKDEFFYKNNIPLRAVNVYDLLAAYLLKVRWRELNNYIRTLTQTIPTGRLYAGIVNSVIKTIYNKLNLRHAS